MKNSILNLTLVGTVFLAVVLGCSQPKDSAKVAPQRPEETGNVTNTGNTSTAPAEKPVAVTAKNLTKEYEENELAADGKYNGKTLAVSGKVSNIAETWGNVTVSLEGHNGVVSVMCSFEESEKANVAKLKKSQQVTLIGTGDGMTGGLYAGLNKCRIQ